MSVLCTDMNNKLHNNLHDVIMKELITGKYAEEYSKLTKEEMRILLYNVMTELKIDLDYIID